jgi:hypothetical protein
LICIKVNNLFVGLNSPALLIKVKERSKISWTKKIKHGHSALTIHFPHTCSRFHNMIY